MAKYVCMGAMLKCSFGMAPSTLMVTVPLRPMIQNKPKANIIKQIYQVAAPSIVMQSVGSFMNFSMNQILISFTSTATAVFGVYYKLQSFFFMPMFGMNNALVPIVAYNYGARNKEKMMKTMKIVILHCLILII